MTNDIEKCKICGGTPTEESRYGAYNTCGGDYLACTVCGICTDEFDTVREALDEWNRIMTYGEEREND